MTDSTMTNHNTAIPADIHVAVHESTGHLIPAGNGEGLALSRCAGVGCDLCKKKIPVQRYKFYRTQWLPVDVAVTVYAAEL